MPRSTRRPAADWDLDLDFDDDDPLSRNLYCTICHGPTTGIYHERVDIMLNDNATGSIEQLPGVNHDDAVWLSKSTVAIYADCISPPGEYDSGSRYIQKDDEDAWGEEDEEEEEDEVLRNEDGTKEVWCQDTLRRPNGMKSPLKSHEFVCDNKDQLLAHEQCIWLAYAWARDAHPDFFPDDPMLNPAHFLWGRTGPRCRWFYDSEIAEQEDEEIHEQRYASRQAEWARSERAKKAAIAAGACSANAPKPLKGFLSKFKYGYAADDAEGQRWMRGCKEWIYLHKPDFDTTHLKRPDRFPRVYGLPVDTPSPPSRLPFLFQGPREIIGLILSEIDDDTMLALECVSREWRDFLRCRFAQRYIWLSRAEKSHFVPTVADWTRSADAVREMFDSAEGRASVDWRGYYDDCLRSPNMQNRARIFRSVWAISHHLGHCDCADGSPLCS